jgi:hypothetical protein
MSSAIKESIESDRRGALSATSSVGIRTAKVATIIMERLGIRQDLRHPDRDVKPGSLGDGDSENPDLSTEFPTCVEDLTMSKTVFLTLGLPLVAACALTLGACGETTPSGNNTSADMSVAPDMTVLADTTAPTFSGAQSATAALGSITLTWNAASDDRTAASGIVYQIYQSTTSMGQTFTNPAATSAAGATSHKLTGLTASTKYFYVVRAQDAAGNIDKNTLEVSATTPAPDLQAPTFGGVTGATAAGNSITLNWTAATDNNSQPANIVYRIYQATTAGGQNFATATFTSNPGATSFQVPYLTPSTTYYFVVRAVDESGNVSTNTQERSAMAVTPTFAANVQPLLTNACAGCHQGAGAANGLDLSAGKAYAAMVGVNSKDCPSTKLVMASQANNSYMMMKINGAGVCFVGGRMPPGGALPAAQASTISGWINAGALNN